MRATILYLRRTVAPGMSGSGSKMGSRLPNLHLQRRMEAMLHPPKKSPAEEDDEEEEEQLEEKSKEDYDVEHCLKLVMMDLNINISVNDPSEDSKLNQTKNSYLKIANENEKSPHNDTAALKHNQKKCAKCTRLYYVVNILVEGCLMALVRQSLEHVDLLITKMELKGVTDRAIFLQYLQHGLTLSDKVDSFYQRQDRLYNAFKVCARMRHSKTAQDLIKQGFELLNEMRELNNKYQVSIENFCNLMAENSGVPIEGTS